MKKQTTELLGKNVGRIRVVDVLGKGDMGAVYVGFDDTLQHCVTFLGSGIFGFSGTRDWVLWAETA
jgi:hypothetical protein